MFSLPIYSEMARIRFLQTSDIHLRQDRPERAQALVDTFALVQERSIDAVLIAGDLFDRASDSVEQRRLVRRLIESISPRPVVLIPGNHDATSYGVETDYGDNAVVLRQTPIARTSLGGVEIVGVPYQQGKSMAECLAGVGGEPRHTVLMGHGTVLDGTVAAFAGEGEAGAYMPIFLQDLLRRCSYAALGHLHSGRNLIHRDQERLVAYAGSPVATSRRELGPRCALVVDFEASAGVLDHELVRIPTPYYERVEILCTPGAEADSVARLAREAAAKRAPGARVLARLSGVSLTAEASLRSMAEQALERSFRTGTKSSSTSFSSNPQERDACVPLLEFEAISYASLAETPIIADFVHRLEACVQADGIDDPVVIQRALRIGLNAFLESLP